MTPMQQLKNNLEILSENLSESFVEIDLNKAKSKIKYAQKADDEYCLCFPEENNVEVFEKKEIKSDFIKLFKTRTKKDSYSIGLHFYFFNREKKDYIINISLQTKDRKTKDVTFLMSKDFNVDEFKDKLNIVNKNLVLDKSVENIIQNLKENMLIQDIVKKIKMM